MSKTSQMYLLGGLFVAIGAVLVILFEAVANALVGGLNPFGGDLATEWYQYAVGIAAFLAAAVLAWLLARRALAAIVG